MSTIRGGPVPPGGTMLPVFEVFNPAAYAASASRILPGAPSAASAMAPNGTLGTPALGALFVAAGLIYYFGRRGEAVGFRRTGHRIAVDASATG